MDGVWKEWSVWDECNVTCGGGRQSRYRTCIQPQFGGLPCNGSDIETIDCNTQFCPGNVYIIPQSLCQNSSLYLFGDINTHRMT